MRLLMFVGVAAVVGCADPNAAAALCGDLECPVGTAPAEERAVREGIDLDADIDPATYSGEVAFKYFGEGECAYACATINPCTEGTFPVITESCFTCGVVNAEGDVAQGACE